MSIRRGVVASPAIRCGSLRVIIPQLYAAVDTINAGLANQGTCLRQR
jgi:hypothetical protein